MREERQREGLSDKKNENFSETSEKKKKMRQTNRGRWGDKEKRQEAR